ncbi:MAG: restriction endonuclease [Terriglobia bacterium]
MWEVRVSHPGLNKFRVVRGVTRGEAELKAALQQKTWDEQWQRTQATRARERARERATLNKELRKQLAEEQTEEATKAITAVENLLQDGVRNTHSVDWSKLKDHSHYPAPKPPIPQPQSIPSEPLRMAYPPKLNWLTGLLTPIREKRMAEAEQRFQAAHSAWRVKRGEVEGWNKRQMEGYQRRVADWEAKKASWLRDQEERNATIDNKRATYLRCEPSAVVEYCEMVLNASEYPETFPSGFELDYIAETRMLVLDYSLPYIEALPKFKAYRYVATRDEIQPAAVGDSWLNKTYDVVLYQIALRTMYELFQSDEAQALDAAVFNGWVNSIDKATGKEVNACVLTIQASRSEFLEINLGQVDPKACFKKLKGISAAKLTALSPVRPILQLNKEDKRFIQPQNVMEHLDDSANLAAMDWEDFEHLIRQVFQKEFSSEGGEVKITQASRDGGVDAVVFDPDPIRGGKIIIQAKRYTNTVGVSAVRDLYGTILNEGANKGILVTTANYGPDAYEFAKDKPITLLSGNELLYLLQKHGHKARIDLAEARLLAAEREKTDAK